MSNSEAVVRKTLRTPIGAMRAEAIRDVIVSLSFVEEGATDDVSTTTPAAAVLDALARELDAYFAGRLREFDVPLDPRGSSFQLEVWDALRRIPYGETTTYAAQAEALGRADAIRAVARANGENPIAIVIPCHRVVGSDGRLVGYGGGLERKRFLLDLELKYGDLKLTAG